MAETPEYHYTPTYEELVHRVHELAAVHKAPWLVETFKRWENVRWFGEVARVPEDDRVWFWRALDEFEAGRPGGLGREG